MGKLDDMIRRQTAEREAEMAEAEQAAIASGKEPFDFARLEALLGSNPGTYAKYERDLRRSYYVMQERLRTLAEFADYVREMQSSGFWDDF